MSERTIEIAQLIGSKLCIASDDGEKVHDAIVAAIEAGDTVRLSFEGVEDLTSSFLNAAIGQLYGKFSEEELRSYLLPPVGCLSDDLALLKRVVERAKGFFKDPDRYRLATKEALGDDSE